MFRPLAWFLLCLITPGLAFSQASSDFTFVLLPDTQNEAQFFPSVLSSQTQWIVDNQAKLNIQAVLGLGDIVNDGTDPAQQKNADAAVRLLDNAQIPYFLGIGNHDYDGGDDAGVVARAVSGFNQWFGPSRYAGKSYYRGNFPSGSNENFYGVLTINGKQYLILVLEFIPRTTSLNWAAQIVQANPDKEVIVVTHSYLFVDGTTADRCDTEDKPRADNDGESMWQNFVSKYANIIMVVNGHLTAGNAARRADLGVNGNLINSMFSNYQTLANGGDGWLRILTFHPASNTISVQTYSPYLKAYMTDSSEQFTVNYHNPGFHTGTGKITGRVTGSGCQSVSGATVSAGSASATTDANGRFSLQVAPGTYQVNVSAQGWNSGTRTAQVNDNYSSDMNFYLTVPSPCPLRDDDRSVTVCSPGSGTAVDSPVHLVAATGDPVMTMEVWENANKLTEATGNVIDTKLDLGPGQHTLVIHAVEPDTSVLQASTTFTVGSTPPPPPPPSDFSVSAAPGNQSVKAGDSATYTINVAPQNGAFNNAVALSCSGLPAGAECSFNPPSVTPGSAAVNATLTISTAAPVTGSLLRRLFLHNMFSAVCAVMFPIAGLVFATGKRRRIQRMAVLCLLLAAGCTLSSCGRGLVQQATVQQTTPTQPVTPSSPTSTTATTSTVTIHAVAGTTTHSTTVTLTMQ